MIVDLLSFPHPEPPSRTPSRRNLAATPPQAPIPDHVPLPLAATDLHRPHSESCVLPLCRFLICTSPNSWEESQGSCTMQFGFAASQGFSEETSSPHFSTPSQNDLIAVDEWCSSVVLFPFPCNCLLNVLYNKSCTVFCFSLLSSHLGNTSHSRCSFSSHYSTRPSQPASVYLFQLLPLGW